MGNNDPYEVRRYLETGSPSPKQQQKSLKPQRVGLTPTDGSDYIRRSSNSRTSNRRPRNERISYLVANGHLDLDETKQFTSTGQINAMTSLSSSAATTAQPSPSNSLRNELQLLFNSKPSGPFKTVAGDQALLNDYTNQFDNINDNIFMHKSINKSSRLKSSGNNSKRYKKPNRQANSAKFKKTYTEVMLPMKTSPAFEYILQDDRRRTKRCYLWLLYLLLVSICFAIIAFCSYHLVKRQSNYR